MVTQKDVLKKIEKFFEGATETIEYKLPAYWASALINNDYSGLEEPEIKALNDFVDRESKDYKMFYCVEVSDEQYFSNSNDANFLAGDVLDYYFQVK